MATVMTEKRDNLEWGRRAGGGKSKVKFQGATWTGTMLVENSDDTNEGNYKIYGHFSKC